jgi:exopolysaccharide biosynthesis polyprenyl glycosylphosphotransferase
MNATTTQAVLPEELAQVVDGRTLEILERRRGSTTHHRRGWLVRRTLVIADLIGLAAAFLLSELVLGNGGPHSALDPASEYLLFVCTLPGWLFVAKLYGLYDNDEERTDHTTVDEFVGVFHLVTIGAWLFFAGSWLTGLIVPDLKKLVMFWGLAIAFVVTARALGRAFCRRRLTYLQNAVIVGAGDIGQLVARKLGHHPEYGINLVGFVDTTPKEARSDLGQLRLLGGPDQLREIVQAFDIERVIVAFSTERDAETLHVVRMLKTLDVQVDIVPRLFEAVGPRVGIHAVEGMPLVGLPPARPSQSSLFVKRVIDVVFASAALVVTAPLFAYIAWRIKHDSPGPVFFRQERLGMNMEPFTLLKFRTMREGIDESVHEDYIKATMSSKAAPQASGVYKLERENDVTKVGAWLRSTSLDELPQLINVIKGDMSLVGPRPCLRYETEQFSEHQFERFLMPAGLTGLWQVTARAHSTFFEAIEMDVAYVRGWSLGLDLSLLCRTPIQVLKRTGTA